MSKTINSVLEQAIKTALKKAGLPAMAIKLEHPADEAHGDYATNITLIMANKVKKKPLELVKKIVEKLNEDRELTRVVGKIEIAGPGFINFFLSGKFLIGEMYQYIDTKKRLSVLTDKQPQKLMVEFAHPNTHKPFHIGHLRNISLGESLARILSVLGHKIIRANYQGDVGLHIAKCLYQIKNEKLKMKNLKGKTLEEKIKFLGEAYAQGNRAYETDEAAKKQIIAINRQIYEKDAQIITLWQETRTWSLVYFDKIYQRLDTKFDRLYFESEVLEGIKLVKKALQKGILQKSGRAIIFNGDQYGLDTRVFINSAGLPTYEAKELKLAEREFSEFGEINKCIHVVSPEQKSFFQVTFKVEELLDAKKYKNRQYHFSYGYVRLKKGRMSSRAGTIIEANWLLDEVKKRIKTEFKCADETAETIAVAAVKYSMLKINPQSDLIFDIDESISLEGNSGPYLQYTYARCQSVINKAKKNNLAIKPFSHLAIHPAELTILRTIYKFPEVICQAGQQYAPNLIANFLFDLAQKYNAFYNKHRIINSSSENLRLALTKTASQILKTGLSLLGIKTLEKM